MSGISERLPQGLHLLDLSQPMHGSQYFIAPWFFVDPAGRRVLVDPGPANSIPTLLKELSYVTDGVDLILLTHIHLDHAGGVGLLCECKNFGGAKVVVHPKGARHLVAPEKLWKASLATLGGVAAMYGEPKPLAPENLADYDDFPEIEVIETPGHAPHHMSFIVPLDGDRLFFIGESAGMRIPVESGTQYLRPTTPPRFDALAAHESLAKIESALRDCDLLCYAHWGAVRHFADVAQKSQIAAAGRQLDEWLDVISKMEGHTVEEIAEYLISNDPFLAGYSSFFGELRSRELFYIENSIKGFLEYLSDSKH